jgi:hypothetical protein
MPEIIKTYKQNVPAARFIGKKYGDGDRVNGFFGAKWEEWFQNGWFAVLEKLDGVGAFYEDADAYIGLMRSKDGEPFEYWIGMFTPVGTAVPEGFESVDFPESVLGVTWVKGPEWSVYMQEDACAQKLTAGGGKIKNDEKGATWFFERYGCPRFTTPDEEGNVILDFSFYMEKA